MQKSTKKASILIWTIFLSIIISMAFLGISTKIHKNIKNSGDFITQLDNQNQIQNHINLATLSESFQNKVFEDILLSFEDQKNITRGLWVDKSIEIKLKNTTNATVQIQVNSGWPIIYKYLNSSSTTTSSGVINNSSTFPINLEGSIFIKNLWWNADFSIITNSGSLLPPTIQYTVRRKVWNLDNVQSSWIIQNFISWDF